MKRLFLFFPCKAGSKPSYVSMLVIGGNNKKNLPCPTLVIGHPSGLPVRGLPATNLRNWPLEFRSV